MIKNNTMVKKIILISVIFVICIGMLYIITITDHEGISAGMSYEDLCDLLENKKSYQYYNYIFLTNKWGNPIVVELNYNDFSVSKIRCYSSLWTSTSPHAFEQIEEGMSISEVTSRVGIPFTSRTGGKITLNYHSESEDEYVIYFDLEKDWTITVESVHIYDPKTKTKTKI